MSLRSPRTVLRRPNGTCDCSWVHVEIDPALVLLDRDDADAIGNAFEDRSVRLSPLLISGTKVTPGDVAGGGDHRRVRGFGSRSLREDVAERGDEQGQRRQQWRGSGFAHGPESDGSSHAILPLERSRSAAMHGAADRSRRRSRRSSCAASSMRVATEQPLTLPPGQRLFLGFACRTTGGARVLCRRPGSSRPTELRSRPACACR